MQRSRANTQKSQPKLNNLGTPQARTKLGRNSECTVLTKELNKLRKNHHKISLPQSQKKHEKKHIINFGPDFFSGIFCVFSGRILHFFLGKVFCFLRRNFQNYSRALLFFSGSFQKKILGHFEYFSGRIVKIFLGCFFFFSGKKKHWPIIKGDFDFKRCRKCPKVVFNPQNAS